MKTIQKLTLTTQSKPQTLSLVRGYRIVRLEYLVTEKLIYLWVEVPLKADIPSDRKEFVVKKSYETIPSSYEHIHTAIDLLKPEAYHVFEIKGESQSSASGEGNKQDLVGRSLVAA